jgi:hypothetical protein
MNVEQKQIWIGLVSVQPLPDSDILKDACGAHVNVLTWASGAAEFREKAQQLMNYLHLIVTGVENPEPLRNRGEIKDFDDTIADIASQVQQNPDAVMYGTFHSWRDPGV